MSETIGMAYCGRCPERWDAPHDHCGKCHRTFATEAGLARHLGRRGQCIDPGTLQPSMRKLRHRARRHIKVWTYCHPGKNGYLDADEQASAA